MIRKLTLVHPQHRASKSVVFLGAMLLLSACQTSGGNGIFGDSLPKPAGTSQQPTDQQQVANASPGTNPNAGNRLANTTNALTNYCPAVRIRAGTEALRVYKGNDRSNSDAVRYQATLTKVARECNYVGGNLEIKVGARGRVITGPAGFTGTAKLPIRVAVQEGNCSRHFKLHQQQAQVPSGSTTQTFQFVDETIVIPAPSVKNIRIYLGFDETPGAKSSAQACQS